MEGCGTLRCFFARVSLLCVLYVRLCMCLCVCLSVVYLSLLCISLLCISLCRSIVYLSVVYLFIIRLSVVCLCVSYIPIKGHLQPIMAMRLASCADVPQTTATTCNYCVPQKQRQHRQPSTTWKPPITMHLRICNHIPQKHRATMDTCH